MPGLGYKHAWEATSGHGRFRAHSRNSSRNVGYLTSFVCSSRSSRLGNYGVLWSAADPERNSPGPQPSRPHAIDRHAFGDRCGDARCTRIAVRPGHLGGGIARSNSRADGRGIGPIGGFQPPRSHANPPGSKCREWIERRDRPATSPALCCAGRRRARGRRGPELDLVWCQADHLGTIGWAHHWWVRRVVDGPGGLQRMDG